MSESASLQVIPLGNGRFEVVEGTRRRTAFAMRQGSAMWVFVDGRVFVVEHAPQGERGRRAHGAGDDEAALAAPMPATVVSINVAPGDRIARGDVLMTLEAMKMELAIRAPRDGTVRRLACRAGELVQPGVPLLEIE